MEPIRKSENNFHRSPWEEPAEKQSQHSLETIAAKQLLTPEDIARLNQFFLLLDQWDREMEKN